jgi:hypothetical protein
MKVTIDLPEALYRRVKAQASADGRTVRDVTIELYEGWLAPDADQAEAERLARAEAWLAEWFRLGDELSTTLPPSDRTAVQILLDDRRAKDW